MKSSNKLYCIHRIDGNYSCSTTSFAGSEKYIRKDTLIELIKLAYGKVSMNPFDCSEAFEELLNKIEVL